MFWHHPKLPPVVRGESTVVVWCVYNGRLAAGPSVEASRSVAIAALVGGSTDENPLLNKFNDNVNERDEYRRRKPVSHPAWDSDSESLWLTEILASTQRSAWSTRVPRLVTIDTSTTSASGRKVTATSSSDVVVERSAGTANGRNDMFAVISRIFTEWVG